MSGARRVLPVGLLLLVGCATNGGLRRVETQVAVLRVETARRDSARAAELDRIIALQDRLLDSLVHTQQALHAFRSTTVADLADIARQLVQIQELTGQSQQRLSELRSDLEARIQASTALAVRNMPAGYRRDGDVYTSPGYEGAENRVDLTVNQAMGALTVRLAE